MPLKHGHGPEVVSGNIRELMKSGYKSKHAVAIALAKKRESQNLAMGGEAGDAERGVDPNKFKKFIKGAGGSFAEGGAVGGAKTSTTGNKTKTGGSNPGGASTGGAGTVTITTGKMPPRSISVSGVGGTTESRNAGGMDPSDENDEFAEGGEVQQKSSAERIQESFRKRSEEGVTGRDYENAQKKKAEDDRQRQVATQNYAKGGYVEAEDDNMETSGRKKMPMPSAEYSGDEMISNAKSEMEDEEIPPPHYAEDSDDEGLSSNVEYQEALAHALQHERYAANQNSVSYRADAALPSAHKIAHGGLVQEEDGQPLGNKPKLPWIDDGTGEPMSSMPSKPDPMEHAQVDGVPVLVPHGLSEEAIKAIADRKKKRRWDSFGQ